MTRAGGSRAASRYAGDIRRRTPILVFDAHARCGTLADGRKVASGGAMSRGLQILLAIAAAAALGGCDGPAYHAAKLRHFETAGFSLEMTGAEVDAKLRGDASWTKAHCDNGLAIDRGRPQEPEIAVSRPPEKDAIRYCEAWGAGKSLRLIGQIGPSPHRAADGPAPKNFIVHYRVAYDREHSVKTMAAALMEKYGPPTEAAIAVDYSFAHLIWRTAYGWRNAYGLLRLVGTVEHPSVALEVWVKPHEVTFDLRDAEAFSQDMERYQSVVIEQDETRKQSTGKAEPLQF